MYHFELQAFPNVYTQFNVSERDMALFLMRWIDGAKIDVGEHRWDPSETKLTVIEGPPLELNQLSLGRGWAAAVRSGSDVTGRVLEAVRAPAPAVELGPAEPAAIGDLLGEGGDRLLQRWREVAGRAPELKPSEALALAEHALRTEPR